MRALTRRIICANIHNSPGWWFQLARQVEGEWVCCHAVGRVSKWTCKPLGERAVKSWGSALSLFERMSTVFCACEAFGLSGGLPPPHPPLLYMPLFTSRYTRGCGFVCSPAVLLAAAALFVHQPLFSRLRLFLYSSCSSRDCGFGGEGCQILLCLSE